MSYTRAVSALKKIRLSPATRSAGWEAGESWGVCVFSRMLKKELHYRQGCLFVFNAFILSQFHTYIRDLL